ncbi:MAG TPA: SpoIIE family protein phosphatase, partial [Bacteroidia bacterium]|nr:SpoIIE family protein phosphatase [Bacteroidia bacterium]
IVNSDHSIVQFTNHTLEIKKEDIIYLFSDGFPDQKGGAEKKKYYYQPFKDLLTSLSHLPAEEQQQKLDTAITLWMGETEQIDDILVMGIRF